MRRSIRIWLTVASLSALALIVAACGGGSGGSESGGGGTGGGSGSKDIKVEGSSTVAPVTKAVSDAFMQENWGARISVGSGGTGDGFEAFCAGKTDISDASRPIDQEEELPTCEENGVEFITLPVGLDGIAVVGNPQNDWASELTLEELKTMWAPEAEGSVSTWADVNSQWPDNKLALFGPGTESGTFDFFTEAVVGEEGASRSDYQASEDDNVLVQGVAGNQNALGYFGLAFYENNQDTLKLFKVDGVEPSADTISSGEYPISRPLFIYVNKKKLEDKKILQDFVGFYLEDGNLDKFVKDTGYVALPDSTVAETRTQFEERQTGSLYTKNGELPGGNLEEAMKKN
ncbi:PstS family phosphate ABC transporter substrate-binding protein [soil metagenome]